MWFDRESGVALNAAFRSATPFPHVVIEDFLPEDLARRVLAEFPPLDTMKKSNDYIFGNKRALEDVSSRGPASTELNQLFLSPAFAEFVSGVFGEELFIDPGFHGGGFHNGGDGSFLDMHVDFNVHPDHPDWLRVLNILVYLNEDWKPEYGGDLRITKSPDEAPRTIEPLFNRGVIMMTSEITYHGYEKMSLPQGVSRKSVAAYAYKHVPVGSVEQRTTGWHPTTTAPLKKFAAKHWNSLSQAKRRLLSKRDH